MSKQIVVLAANGAQGSAIAQSFATSGHRVRGVTRSGGGSLANVTYATADIADVQALSRAFDGADAVVFTSVVDHRPGVRERIAEAVVAAADRAGVGRLVLNTAAPVFAGYDRPVSSVLRRVREIVLGASTPAVVLQPTVYMDNLRAPWALPGIVRDGAFAYPLPADSQVSWISHQTLGEYATAAATKDGVAGLVFDIGGATAVTGVDVAALLAVRAGRPVQYVPLPLDGFAAGLNAAFGPPTGDDIADLYRYEAEHPSAMIRDPSAAAILGVEPESFAAFIARHDWSTASA